LPIAFRQQMMVERASELIPGSTNRSINHFESAGAAPNAYKNLSHH